MGKTKKKEVIESPLDVGLLMITLCLIAFGLLMIYSTSSYTSQVRYGDSMYFLKKQIFGVAVGLAAMFVVMKIHYKLYLNRLPLIRIRFVTFIYWIAVTLQIMVLIVGEEFNGAKRWLRIGGLSLQPSEITKIAVILIAAYYIQKNPTVLSKFRGLVRVIIPIGFLLALVIVENLSTAIVIGMIAIGMCFIAAKNKKLYIVLILAAIGGAALFIVLGDGFRMTRIRVWMDIENEPLGYQILQGLYAIASGGVFGTGLGESMQKLGFIPESHNDMIFSIVCEELGIVGAGIVLLMFGIMIWRIFKIAVSAPDLFSGMICAGVMIHIAAQVIINVAVVTNSIPSTGIPLPFISYGGTSIAILMAEMGLVLGISAKRKSG